MPGFTSPPDPTLFKARVWELVQQIPPGRVASYGQIASWLGPPPGMPTEDYRAFGARWVGGALAACPPGVPWQRVLNAQGKISLPGAHGEHQRQLLETEGVVFDAKGRIDLKQFGWAGPAPV